MVTVVALEQECSEQRPATQGCECLKSGCMGRTGPELLPAEKGARAGHSLGLSGRVSESQSNQTLLYITRLFQDLCKLKLQLILKARLTPY